MDCQPFIGGHKAEASVIQQDDQSQSLGTEVTFWFDFASAYSYPAAVKAIALEKEGVVRFRWRPFVLGVILQELYPDTSRILVPAVKWRYMMKDIQRVCDALGTPYREPSVFPRSGILAARVFMVADKESWRNEYVSAVFRANFASDLDISSAGILSSILDDCGAANPIDFLNAAEDVAIKEQLRSNTDLARELGVFGAPTVTVGAEIFWGGDRMERAIRWQNDCH